MTSYRSSAPRGIPILGYTTRRHLLLDIDNSTHYKTWSLAHMIMKEWPKVGDCLIMLSSLGPGCLRTHYNKYGRPLMIYRRNNYHLIFDNAIGYNSACRICRVLAELGILERDYVRIREFRGDMTLRVSPALLYNEYKPIPVYISKQLNLKADRRDGYIDRYLSFKKMVERLFLF